MGIYGALKFGAEKLVIGYQRLRSTYTIIRPSALYGERCVNAGWVRLSLKMLWLVKI